MQAESPDVVAYLTDAVGDRLGRPAYCRQVKNQQEWYIHDPVISFVQHGMKKGNTGYRVGYYYAAKSESIWFSLVHSPIMARLFKKNLVFSTLIEIITSTSEYRTWHAIHWSSKRAVKCGEPKDSRKLVTRKTERFIELLHLYEENIGFVEDLFPVKPNTGKGGGKAPVAGNTFFLRLADRTDLLASRKSVDRLVELSWPLFLCLYPVKPIEKRTAALAKKLKAQGIPKVCEFSSIHGLPAESVISHLCRGQIQGAHITPDNLGGSDKAENGLWLCEYHHRETEGKLEGRRTGGILDVRFRPKK